MMNTREQWAQGLLAQSEAGLLVKKLTSLESDWMSAFIFYGEGIPIPEYEYPFNPDDEDQPLVHRNRFDFAWPEYRVYLECDGGIWTGGGHSRGENAVKNLERQNLASSMGWMPIRFAAGMDSPEHAETLFNQLRKTLQENQCLINQRDNVPASIRELLRQRQTTPLVRS